jgi:hypothetical protein
LHLETTVLVLERELRMLYQIVSGAKDMIAQLPRALVTTLGVTPLSLAGLPLLESMNIESMSMAQPV